MLSVWSRLKVLQKVDTCMKVLNQAMHFQNRIATPPDSLNKKISIIKFNFIQQFFMFEGKDVFKEGE